MSLQSGREEAARLAAERLKTVDFVSRCADIGLPLPTREGIDIRAFGTDFLLRLPSFDLVEADGGAPAKPGDRVLAMRYLLQEEPLVVTGKRISFKGYPEGQFYWKPFLARSVNPLLERVGNDLELLRKHLDRFDWEEVAMGDFGAKIHLIGKLDLILAYHLGDDEFPPDANILFDACIGRVYSAEDAAVLAGRICFGLL